ncbi:MAG: tyrosine-type recombinase/integrase [Pirellulaceae bacterium]|nr:tyrosine-type recombinase/integrase [Pirellulaceae bacterium]
MGSIKKKTVTRPLPPNAKLAERRNKAKAVELVATWTDRTGKKQTGVVLTTPDGSQRVRMRAATWTIKYRDGAGIVREVATGCRDKQAALAKLSELESTADKIKIGALTEQDLDFGRHNRTPIVEHVADYIDYLRQERKHPDRIKTTERRLLELCTACQFERLPDLQADRVTGWINTQSADVHRGTEIVAGRSPAVLNGYIEAIVAFGYWLAGKRVRGKKSNQLGEKRLGQNPFAGIGRLNVKTDRRRKRRALSESELQRLLFVARWRPLAEYGREVERLPVLELPDDPKSRKTWTRQALALETIPQAVERAKSALAGNPDFVEEQDRLGFERALIYKLAVLTGLRRGEIEALTLDHLRLDGSLPFVEMRPQDTKNREAVEIPLRDDLADDLRQWIDGKQKSRNDVLTLEIKRQGLRGNERLFNVPKQLVKILNRDLAAAGIPKTDERGRTVDVHALRHTFGTLLSTSGVAPRTAQQAMRHSDIGLTMNVYTDPRLLDVAGAVEALPKLPLTDSAELPELQKLRATGTENHDRFASRTVAPTVAPDVAPTAFKACQNLSNSVENGESFDNEKPRQKTAKTPSFVGFSVVGATRFELATSTSRT